MTDIEKLNYLAKSKRIRNIIKRVSSDRFDMYSYMEKATIYKELNDILNEKFNNNIAIYINKFNDDENDPIERSEDIIVLNGLDYNPYIYIRDIIFNHAINNIEDEGIINFGNIYYSCNYLSSDYDIFKYTENNYP